MTQAPPRLRAFFLSDPCRRCAPPRLLYARPVRRLFLGGVAVQAVAMGRINPEDIHLVGEERKVLQGQRRVAVLGVALDDGQCGQMAFRTQEKRKIRSSDGSGENSVRSTMVRGMISADLEVIREMSAGPRGREL